MSKKFAIRTILLGLLIVVGWGLARPVLAGTGLTVQPIKINRVLTAGTSFSDKISVANQSDDTVVVEVKAEDFIPLAGQDSYQFVGRAPGVTTVRDWITFDDDLSTLTLKEGEQLRFGYTITAPPDAEPGSHFGVIFLKAIKESDLAQQLKIGTQLGILVFITIPGDYLESGKILDFTAPRFIQHGPVPFEFTFQNTGTIHLAPSGKISITNLFGRPVGEVGISSQAVLPTGARHLALTWDNPGFLFGIYRAKLVLVDSKSQPMATAETTFYALPWLPILLGIIGVIILFFLLRFIKRRVRFSICLKILILAFGISGFLIAASAVRAAEAVLTVTISATEVPPVVPGVVSEDRGLLSGGGRMVAGVNLNGRAYPLSKVTALKDGQIAATTIAGPDAKFNLRLSGLAAGNYNFSVYGEDNRKIRSAPLTFPVFITEDALTTIGGIFLSPTLALDKSQVKRGDNLAIFGQTTPNGVVTIEVNSENQIFAQANSASDGSYLYNLDSSLLTMGQHLIKSKAALGAELSAFGNPLTFIVGTKNVPFNLGQDCSTKGDPNRDCLINLVDFSIAAFWYKKPLSPAFAAVEVEKLTGDGLVDLRDFSVMAYYWTG